MSHSNWLYESFHYEREKVKQNFSILLFKIYSSISDIHIWYDFEYALNYNFNDLSKPWICYIPIQSHIRLLNVFWIRMFCILVTIPFSCRWYRFYGINMWQKVIWSYPITELSNWFMIQDALSSCYWNLLEILSFLSCPILDWYKYFCVLIEISVYSIPYIYS